MAIQRRGRTVTRAKAGKISATVRRSSRTPSRAMVMRKPSRARSAPAKSRYAPAKQEPVTTGLSQMTYAMSKVTVGKPMSRQRLTDKLTRAALEPVIYRWNGVRAFVTRGNYWMQNRVVTAGYRSLPFYMFDLTAINNFVNGSAQYSNPFIQMGMETATGRIGFQGISGFAADGTTATNNFIIERAPTAPLAVDSTSSEIAPLSKSMLEWASIQMNLWGCTAKATKFCVQLVRISDRDLIPQHQDNGLYTFAQEIATCISTPKALAKKTEFYQNLIKPWTFNPIATTGGLYHKSYKVLKTHEFTIEPNLTIDGDADANVKVFKMYAKLNKMCNYVDTAVNLTSDAQLITNPTFVQNVGTNNTCQVKPTSRVYLVVRSTNYGNDAADSPTDTPSFDLSIKVKHTVAQ